MIVTESYDDPDVQLLMTLPGVDYTTAHAIKATLADVGDSRSRQGGRLLGARPQRQAIG